MANLLDDYPEMFPDRCDTYPMPPSARGGPRGVPALRARGVPCSVQPARAAEVTGDSSVPADAQTSVFFQSDPGSLPTDSQIVVTAKDGDGLDVPVRLNVIQLVSHRLAGFAEFRADCTGRA